MNELVNDLLKFPSVLKYKNKNVTFFGSARFDEENFYCKKAYELAYKLNELGFAILTGGGDGIMRAANKGAFDSAKSPSVALNVRLPFEQSTNPYVTAKYLFSNLSPIFFNDNPFLISLFYCISFTGKFPDLSSKILLDFFHVPFLVFSFKGFPLIMQFFPFCKPYLHLHKSLLCID